MMLEAPGRVPAQILLKELLRALADGRSG